MLARECLKRGIPTKIFGRTGANPDNADIDIVELFRLDIFAEARPQNPLFAVFESYFLINRVFFQDLNTIPSVDFALDDLVYFPNITQNQIEAVADWVIGLPVENRPHIAITLRYLGSQMGYNLSRGYGPAIDLLYSHALPKLMERHPRTHLFSDTQALSNHYIRLSNNPVTMLPNPQNDPSPQNMHEHAADKEGLTVLFLGGWGQIHGSDYVPYIAEHLLNDSPEVNFIVQVNSVDPDSKSAHAMYALSEAFPSRVSLLHGPIAYDDYRGALDAADIVLVLYLPSNYSFASSGVFTEAAALGKVLAITAGTTMEISASAYGLGAVVAQEFTPESCLEAVRTAIVNFEELDQKAKSSYASYSRENSPEGFFDRMFACIGSKC